MQHFLTSLFAMIKRDEEGATAVEYGLLVGLIAVAIVATLLLLGPELNDMFDRVLDSLTPIA
ncbi:Flp family type IVb pilin [Citricoccus sp. SGAir0253]|uniref:Flp family type IVb pilin n=1 Tax=Citricoccus sp. SGAir0253 TaxID=2567881 RepID=UPI0010CCCACD|nr:Flp family type IVb pilin [Citricoccus sp. SGAir0253]QCU77507.1 Flp family type IVb pilin [Citricoccus sp. SGAir0253]